MNPGLLDRRITIQAPVDTRDGLGGSIRTYSDFRTVSAKKEDLHGVELAAGAALRSESFLNFTIRFITVLSTNYRVLFQGVAHDIVSIQEIGRRNYQILTCRAIEGGAS